MKYGYAIKWFQILYGLSWTAVTNNQPNYIIIVFEDVIEMYRNARVLMDLKLFIS